MGEIAGSGGYLKALFLKFFLKSFEAELVVSTVVCTKLVHHSLELDRFSS